VAGAFCDAFLVYTQYSNLFFDFEQIHHMLIAVIGSSMGPLTGLARNPARDFGPKLMTFFAG
jgi:glycerol uptake facilitator-like aquaporin